MRPVPRQPSIRARLTIAAVTTLLASGAAFWIWHTYRRPTTVVVTMTQSGDEETTWNGQDAYVIDPKAGLRVRRSSTHRLPMVAVDSSDVQEVEKHRDANGFLRAHELPSPLDRPTVLAVGDSHLDGIVSTADNATSLLEAASPIATPYYCLNAGCGYYSLWQHVLRARDLLPKYHPRVVVLVVFLGNDFLDLDNPKFPHLDDTLTEQPGHELTQAETTSARERDLALVAPYSQLFWQGLNQALLLHREPARLDLWMRKARHAITAMEHAAAANEAKVIWALLPSFDLVFPERTQGLSKLADEVVRGGAQRRLRDALVAVLADMKAHVVDVETHFRADGNLALYAMDFHIYRRGHQQLFEALRGPIAAHLR